jgi:hypothetical protein
VATSSREGSGTVDLNVGTQLVKSREGSGTVDLNVGTQLVKSREGSGTVDLNVGTQLVKSREGSGTVDLNVTEDTPTPAIWSVIPSAGQEGWEFRIVGAGFGATQATYNGYVELNGLGCSITSWTLVAATGDPPLIDPATGEATVEHGEITAVVPIGASSGLVVVTTDGP